MAPHFEEPCITACSLVVVVGVGVLIECCSGWGLEGLCLGVSDMGPNYATWGVGFILQNLTKDSLINHKAQSIDDGRETYIET